MMRIAISLLLPLTAALFLPGCASNPATGGADLVLMSESKEIKIGREMHEEMAKKNAFYPDQEVQDYVNKVGQKLAKSSDRPDLEYTFTVIDEESINAFATPGGYVYINRGLMVYLDNEAELAGVLGHEIGHITARHAVRQQTASVANSALATTAYILTGSSDLANASNTYGTSLVRGYGRDMELEADAEGAAYMHRAGYDPDALLEVIGVLKDQEQYNRARAKASGKKPQTYHGVFSTHPRNDKRLQQVIRTAGELEDVPPAAIDPREFRAMMEGLTYGKTPSTAQRQDNRYYHNKLRFTFEYPEGWSVDPGSKAIVARTADDSSTLSIRIKRQDKTLSSRDFLSQQMNAPKLFQSAELSQGGLSGYTGVAPADGSHGERRLAVIYYGSIAYLFEGISTDFKTEDASFEQMIESFRPMKANERQGKKAMYVSYIQVDGNTSFAQLARMVRIPDAENELRLMNGYYPKGEPRVGAWIKIVKQAEQ
jgi:predicted Zn-dependent protease